MDDNVNTDFAGLIDDVEGLSRRELVRLVEQRQEMLMQELCGPKYSRNHEYRREGSYTKTLITSIGRIRFRVKRVIRRTDSSVRSRRKTKQYFQVFFHQKPPKNA